MDDASHVSHMTLALDLAQKAAGHTSPNPVVGAVIVKNGTIIGQGWHRKAGGPHAEIEALRSARESVAGATMYITLEPCCHHGRTPPCSQALIDAQIAEVFYAIRDPNPRVQGGGHRQLEAAGIRVHQGPLEDRARALNRPFFHFIQNKRPYVYAKFAMSLDGRIATHTGSSQWITGEDARQEVMQLRHHCDAILVGSGTVLADDPRLTTRLAGGGGLSPLRVILDSRTGLSVTAKVFDANAPGSTLLFTTRNLTPDQDRLFRDRGIIIHRVTPDKAGFIPPRSVLEALGKRNIVSLLIEGGSRVHGSFFDHGLVQEIWAFIAPKIVGGKHAPGPIGGQGIEKMDLASNWHWFEQKNIGADLLLKARPLD